MTDLTLAEEAAQIISETTVDGDVIRHELILELMKIPPLDDFEKQILENIRMGRMSTFDGLRALKEAQRQYQFDVLEGVESVKESLLVNHQIALKNIRGSGYLRLLPSNQTDEALIKYKRELAKANQRAIQTLEHVRIGMLSLAEKQSREEAQSKVAYLASVQKGRLKAG